MKGTSVVSLRDLVGGFDQDAGTIACSSHNAKDSQYMLDQLRRDITGRLDDLLNEADKLRRALTALGGRQGSTSSPASSASAAPRSRSARGRRATSDPNAARSPAMTTKAAASSPATRSRSATSNGTAKPAARTAPGATKSAVLATLSGGDAMTAGEVASASGLGRATVSTTLSRLAKTGELAKVSRGYQITAPANGSPAQGASTTASR